MTFYKTVRLDGSSFHDPDFKYVVGKTVRRSNTGTPVLCTDTVLHASRTAPLAARYSQWPYRLIEVAGNPVVEDDDKAGFKQLTVVAECDVAECFGPNGAEVLAVVRRCETLTAEEAEGLGAARGAAWVAARGAAWDAARDAARGAAWDAARDAAWVAARGAAWGAARGAAWDAARGAAVSDLIGQYGYTQEHHDLLMKPWTDVIGVCHEHEWVDARNEIVLSGEVCIGCKAVRRVGGEQ